MKKSERFILTGFIGLVLLLVLGASAPDRFNLSVKSTLVLVDDHAAFFTNNATNLRGALTNDFGALASKTSLNTESNRINAVELTAGSAIQPGDLASVATTGAYTDLTGKPNLGTASAQDVGYFATAAQGALAATAVQPAALSSYQPASTILSNVTITAVAAGTGTTTSTNANGVVTVNANGSGGGSGKLVQQVSSTTATSFTTSSTVPIDDTLPQNSEGTEVLTASITPTSTSNKIRVRAIVHISPSSTTTSILSLFRDSNADALSTSAITTTTGTAGQILLTFEETAPSTSAITYKTRVGPNTAVTLTINGVGGSRRFGGAMITALVVEEVAP